jgi:hypothetical protein
MIKKPDLNKLQEEISARKKQKNMMSSSLGENVGVPPKDTFLNGLLEAYRSGRETPSTNLIKKIDIKVAEKKDETPKMSAPRTIPRQVPQHPQAINEIGEVGMMPERDEQMYRDFQSKNKTLVESIQEYINAPVVGAPMRNQFSQGYVQQPVQINEMFINENIKKAVNNYLAESLEPIIQEAFRDTIIEMYSVERIKEVLRENKEMVKGLVIEVIKEIQARNKQAKGQ